LFLFLLVLEPVVTLVLGALALLGVLTALFWKFFGPPNFPFLLMLSISLGLELAALLDAGQVPQICERLRAARCAYYGAFAVLGIPVRAIRALNAHHGKKTWDGAFSTARARI
jgi:hypothetical protein